jgi:hypothetical protein
METNSEIIKNIQVLSKNCSDLIKRISRKEERAGSNYLIEALGQEDIPFGLEVPIDEESAAEGVPPPPPHPPLQGWAQQLPPQLQHLQNQRIQNQRIQNQRQGQHMENMMIMQGQHMVVVGEQQLRAQHWGRGEELIIHKKEVLIFREVTVPRFELVRRPVITPSKEILEKMKFSLEILPVNDLFNDKLDYSVSTCYSLNFLCQVLPSN